MGRNVLLAGAGQLGSRYLQGMALYKEPLSIWALDPSPEALARAKQRWGEASPGCSGHTVNYTETPSCLPDCFDLTILASTANVRPELTNRIASCTHVKNWVFEKVLAQGLDGLALIESTVAGAKAWVNTPMHMWSLYSALRAQFRDGPVQANFEGFRGLACNAIHYIDFISRWNGASVTAVNTTNLKSDWYDAQRAGFYEIDGILEVEFADGSRLRMGSGKNYDRYRARIAGADGDWEIFEAQGYAASADGKRIEGAVEFQSTLTAPMMSAIFETGTCRLPTLSQSIAQHAPFLRALQTHWNACGRTGDSVPIT